MFDISFCKESCLAFRDSSISRTFMIENWEECTLLRRRGFQEVLKTLWLCQHLVPEHGAKYDFC